MESIHSLESIPPAYVAWRVFTSNRVVVPARQAGNQFLGSLKGLQIRAQYARLSPQCRVSFCYCTLKARFGITFDHEMSFSVCTDTFPC